MKKKSMTLLVSILVLVCVTVGGTLAFLIDQTDPLPNTFTPSKVTTSVEETLEGNVKSNVYIKNTGDTTAYIRAAVIVTWQNDEGEVYGQAPASTDYEIKWYDAGWVKIGDYYYHQQPVEAGDNTGILITEAKPLKEAPADGYYLCIEIIGSGIQSEPETVVVSAWGVNVENGVITSTANG